MSFKNHQELDFHSKYHLFWNQEEDGVTMEVQVETHGWVGLGFSSNGGMTGADIFLGWIKDDGSTIYHDRHAITKDTPIIDAIQNYKFLGGLENETHTVLRFSRVWNTCDEDEDFNIEEGTTHLIWAFNNDDPLDDILSYGSYHGTENRGTKPLVLRGPAEVPFVQTPDMKTWDLTRKDYTIPPFKTTYQCEMFKVPQEMREKKHHMVAVSHLCTIFINK